MLDWKNLPYIVVLRDVMNENNDTTRGVFAFHTCKAYTGRYGKHSEEGLNRDLNCLFKFKVGDKVIKRWKWLKNQPTRFYSISMPPGLTKSPGTVYKIYPEHGEICVQCDDLFFHFGASELDLLPNSEESDEA